VPNIPAAGEAEEPVAPETRKRVWIIVLAAMAPALDTTIVTVALAAMGRGLHTSVASTQWTLTGYLLAMGMAMPLTRWIMERFGPKQVLLGSLIVFGIGSALAGAAWNIDSLIVFRVLQGVPAGLIIPLVSTMLVSVAGRNRLGRVMAVASMVVVVVPIFGPVAGGVLVKYLGWRWVFYVNPPICAVAVWLAWLKLPASPGQRGRSLDVLGLGLLAPGLAALIYGLSEASGTSGFAATRAWAPLAAGAALTAGFAFHALRRCQNPLIDLRLLRIRSYAASATVLFLSGLSVYGPLLLLSLYFQEVQGRSALIAGLLLAPQGIGSLIPRRIAGKLTDRIGARPVAIAGLLLTALGTLAFAWAGPSTSEWLLGASLLVRGAGLAPVTIAVQAGAFRDIPPASVPDASSTTRIVQQVGGSLGSAVLALILSTELAHHAATAAGRGLAFDTAFWWAIGLGALALLPAFLLPTAREKDDRPARAQAGEHGPAGKSPRAQLR
jgi:EmrB/QacA subfamily drug resistance transporter